MKWEMGEGFKWGGVRSIQEEGKKHQGSLTLSEEIIFYICLKLCI